MTYQIENFEIVTSTTDGKNYLFNPITKRTIADSLRNRKSLIKQIQKFNLNTSTPNIEARPTTTTTPTTEEPDEITDQLQSEANRKLFKNLQINSRTLNLYITLCDEINIKLIKLNRDIAKCKNNNQLLYIARLNDINDDLNKATKYLLRIFNRLELPYKERLPIVAFYNIYQQRHTEAGDLIKTFKYYADDEAEETANKYHKEELLAHHNQAKIAHIENKKIKEYNTALKKINKLYDEQINNYLIEKLDTAKRGEADKFGVREIIISGKEIRDNLSVDYQSIYNHCNTETEREIFKKKFKNKIKFSDDDESDE